MPTLCLIASFRGTTLSRRSLSERDLRLPSRKGEMPKLSELPYHCHNLHDRWEEDNSSLHYCFSRESIGQLRWRDLVFRVSTLADRDYSPIFHPCQQRAGAKDPLTRSGQS